jgi:hypothetical protein
VAQLCQYQSDLKELGVRVLVVSFAAPLDNRRWQSENCPTFEVLADESRHIYRAYGMMRSFFRSWAPRTFLYYIRALASGRQWRGIQGDANQLGGDFIVNPDGTFLLYHPSQNATDRPEVEEMVEILRKTATR